MRIIAGSKRRLRLKSPEGNDVRPTSDRIKETLFNILQDEIPGSSFLDLFAGSGQIGLEAASRGAKQVVFVEHARKAADCIRANIALTKSENETLLWQSDVHLAIRSLEGKYQFDLVFMDPPYGQSIEKDVLKLLKKSPVLKKDALIIIETALGTDVSYLEAMGYQLVREKKYKTNQHLFIKQGGI